MMFSQEYDHANNIRRMKIFLEKMEIAKGFNTQISRFFEEEVIGNFSLSSKQKQEIIETALKDLIK